MIDRLTRNVVLFVLLLPGGNIGSYRPLNFQVNGTLQELNLSLNSIGPQGAVPIADALKVCLLPTTKTQR